ncbi:mitogen-activated protein kinase kinase kinase 3-like [Juglans regia]|uniref:Mitogen-activated protein kinase kinase kinase 3-like n=1 Tax=Juglans regia TaxID=51240 RepID=A0A6P9ETU5_JUGRE|nr:mitogen-activated protein kinase kinase kinase 3-like [Juglans regia]
MESTFGDGESWVRGPLIGKGGFGSVFLATLKKSKSSKDWRFWVGEEIGIENEEKDGLDVYLRGTPLYMAPEAVIENVHEPPCDIWALGCLVCEMLTGKSPWDREEKLNANELLQLIGDECEVPKIPSGVSDEAKSFLKSCLARKPTYRFTAEMLMDHPWLHIQSNNLPLGDWFSTCHPLFPAQALPPLQLIDPVFKPEDVLKSS